MIDLLEMKRRLARAIKVLGEPTLKRRQDTGEHEPVEEEKRYA